MRAGQCFYCLRPLGTACSQCLPFTVLRDIFFDGFPNGPFWHQAGPRGSDILDLGPAFTVTLWSGHTCPLIAFPRWLMTSSTLGLQAGFQTLIEKNILKGPFKLPQPPTSLSLPESIFPKPLEILIIKTSGACGTPFPQLPEISSLSQLPVNF